jgi:Plasmid pRiA4b ORF-3-like protein
MPTTGQNLSMPTWLSIQVELVSGHGSDLWPRPGRIFAAARTHTFGQLAVAIDDAFARWDRAHLHQFHLQDDQLVGTLDWANEFEEEKVLDESRVRLGRLKAGEQFVYEFDFGDSWLHLCTVGAHRIDPLETLGIVSERPLPYWGWGAMPDQYGRRWEDDDTESPLPEDTNGSDLPKIGPWARRH